MEQSLMPVAKVSYNQSTGYYELHVDGELRMQGGKKEKLCELAESIGYTIIHE